MPFASQIAQTPGASLSLLLVVSACCPEVPETDDFTDQLLAKCGNGKVDTDQEECDDGHANSNEAACTLTCRRAICGDEFVQEGVEECDDGLDNAVHADCTPDCTLAYCGDGVILEDSENGSEEECDDGEANTDLVYGGGCSTHCTLVPACGDNNVDPGVESCDDGNLDDHDDCTSTCQHAVCGDGFLHDGVEDCDDGNDDDTDACLSTCVAATCGDGVIHAGVEECEGDDHCHDCIRDRYVFVLSEVHNGHFQGGDLTGVEVADALCRSRALGAELHTGPDFLAWLSDSQTSPAQRFYRSPGRYVLPNGDVIADNWQDLTDGSIQRTIDINENNVMVAGGTTVWTNTRPDGLPADDPQHCDDWSTNDFTVWGRVGATVYTDAQWTDRSISNPDVCVGDAYVYCFEQE